MYKDVNNKTGYRMLVGTSGKTYANARLLTTDERTAMLADGITEVVPPSVEQQTLDQAKEHRKRALNSEREILLDSATVEYNSVTYDADSRSIDNINGTLTAIQAGITVAEPITWRAADNTNQSLTHAQLTELAGLMFANVQSVYQTSWDKKAAVDAASTVEDVQAVVWITGLAPDGII